MSDVAADETAQQPEPIDSARIVVGVDGSESSREALRWAARLATSIGVPIAAVIAWQVPTSYGYAYMPDGWRPDADAEKVLNETVDGVFGTDRPAGLELLIREGNATSVLLDEAEHAQMLVVGSRGHGGFVGLMLGSVSASLAERASIPVLVVH